MPDFIEIPLTQGKVAIIDEYEFERVSQYKWFANRIATSWYAGTQIKTKKIRLHRFLTGEPQDCVVDHINGNGLDNRHCNLRLASFAQNNYNRKPNKGKRFKGVRFAGSSYKRKFRATIKINKIEQHIGNYFTEEEAARAYDKKAKDLFGEFAWLNFPTEAA